jgi:phosphoribosylaminoimidazole carboxylase (NCAIR synthetase)
MWPPSWTQAPYDDLDALRAFAGACDVITYEFENIPADALDVLSETTPLSDPDRHALEVSQDRLTEKTLPRGAGAEDGALRAHRRTRRPAAAARRDRHARDPEDPALRL